jgi:hypothetical protein
MKNFETLEDIENMMNQLILKLTREIKIKKILNDNKRLYSLFPSL